MTTVLTKVYASPECGYAITDILMARENLQVLGRSADSRWLAVALEHGQGWVSAGELELSGDIAGLPVIVAQAQLEPAGSPQAVTAVLTKVYTGPGFSYAITDILMAQENLQVLGRSADSRWLAVRRPGDEAAATGWIPRWGSQAKHLARQPPGDPRLSHRLAHLCQLNSDQPDTPRTAFSGCVLY